MKNRILGVFAILCAAATVASAQANLDTSTLGKPPVDSWPMYHGDYTGRHYSTLKQINTTNVKNLSLAWVYKANVSPLNAMSGGSVDQAVQIRLGGGALSGGLIKSTPLMVNGTLYFSSPDQAWAVDAHSGKEIWHFNWRTSGGDHIGNRGMAMYGNWLYFEAPDGYVISLDAATGKERWHKQMVDVRAEYFTTVAPVIIKNHVILGMGGDALDVPAWVEARDPETGDLQWKWYTTPRKGEPGAETWPSEFAMEHGGGQPWQPVTYDPDLNLMYVTTGNPNPVTNGDARKGSNLYTASIVALNPDTGKMAWYFQSSPHDTHDWDATQTPVLFDSTINGQPRKLLSQASRNGMFFLLDRTNGKNLLSKPFIESANWFKGFNDRGEPIPNPDKESTIGGAYVSPNNGGGQNWTPPTYDPDTGLLYLNASQGYEIHYRFDTGATGPAAMGHATHAVGGIDTKLKAIDPKTGNVKWEHKYAGTDWNPPRPEHLGGLLSTAGGLVFAGDPGGFMVAYNAETGRQLWHAQLGFDPSNTPITYMLDGKQYFIVAANDLLFAFCLQ